MCYGKAANRSLDLLNNERIYWLESSDIQPVVSLLWYKPFL
ncbi:hypothetical protein [Oceanobacillus jeddahense]|nr:hypothetical protein [Oceanobacillus jeddahense]